MFDYTKAAVEKLVEDFKKVVYVLTLGTQVAYIFYLCYALLAPSGNPIINGLLLVLSLAYLVFFLVMTEYGKTPDGKQAQKRVKQIYGICKKLIKLYTLGLAVYGLCMTANNVNPFSLILTVFMVVGFVLQIIFDTLLGIISKRVNLIIEAVVADKNNLVQPVKTVGNFFKKLTGQEIEPEAEPSKNIAMLDKRIEKKKAEEQEEKLALVQAKKEKAKATKLEKKLLRAAKKQKSNPQNEVATDNYTGEQD
jgi:hypothetical protein